MDKQDLIRFIQEFRVNSDGMRFGQWLTELVENHLLAKNNFKTTDMLSHIDVAKELFYIEDYDLAQLVKQDREIK